MSDKVICPQCGNQYTSVANHWAQSASCTYPELTAPQHEATRGVLLAGGGLVQPSAHPHLSVRSTNKDFLLWLDEQFGVYGKGEVYLSQSADDAAAEFKAQWGTDANPSDVYEWASRTSPMFAGYYDWFTDEGVLQPPSDYRPSIRAFRIWYARRGNIRQDSGRHMAAFHVPPAWSDRLLNRLFSGYQPLITHPTEGRSRVLLRNTTGFFDAIGWDPVPGCADQWPSDDQMDDLATVAADDIEACPSCSGQFTSLTQHWARSDSCDYPALTDHQRTLIQGVLLVRGTITRIDPNGVNTHFSVRATDKPFLEWLSDELGWLARPITALDKADIDRFPNTWAGIEADTFDTVYELRTHAHPELADMRTAWYSDGEKHPPIETIDQSPTLLRAMYATAGVLRAPGGGREQPAISVTRSTAPDEFFLDLFEPFDPVMHRTGHRTLVQLSDREGFFDYIGTLPETEQLSATEATANE